MELDERESVNGKVMPIIPIVRDSLNLRAPGIKIGDKATLYCKGKLIEAVIEHMEGDLFMGSIINAANPDLRGSEIKFAEINIFSVVEK